MFASPKRLNGLTDEEEDEATTTAPTVITATTSPAITMYSTGSNAYTSSTTADGLILSASKTSSGVITLRGALHKENSGAFTDFPSSFTESVFTLPTGYRPVCKIDMVCPASTASTDFLANQNRKAVIEINTDGLVRYLGAKTNVENGLSTSSQIKTIILADNGRFIKFFDSSAFLAS